MKHTNKKNIRPSIYGFHAVREAWLNPNRTIYELYITQQAKDNFKTIISQTKAKDLHRPEPTLIDKNKLEKILPKGAVHQGLALATEKLDNVFIQDMIIKSTQQKQTILLMLDQVTDPHNVGAIIRSACAFGVDGMIMQRKTAPELSGVLAKTACGGIEYLPVAFETNLSRAIKELKENGFFVYGLDEAGYNSIGNITYPEKIVLVLGAEGSGLRRLVKENCDELVKLPTTGKISSLNVSNAAAIALYAISNT